MNKIFNINLGGFAFSIDDDAYEMLQHYLGTLRQHFSKSEGCDEIMGDIESRLAEIFNESRANQQTIIGVSNIKSAIQIMGTPEDFGIETDENAQKTAENAAHTGGGIPTARSFFRDGEDKIIGGVSSGLAAYFGIENPIWVRISFVFFAFLGFAGVLVYLVLWVMTREALTSADRLAMRGEPATAENIGRIISESADKFGEQLSNWGRSEQAIQNRNRFGAAVNRFGKFLSTIFKPVGGILAGLILFCLIIGWVASIWSLVLVSPLFAYISPEQTWQVWLLVVSVFFCVVIPVISFVAFIGQIFYKRIRSPWFQGTLWTVWSVFLVIFFCLFPFFVREMNNSHSFSEVKTFSLPQNGDNTLSLVSVTDSFTASGAQLEHLYISDEYLFNDYVPIKFILSDNDSVKIETQFTSRGKNLGEAKELAQKLNFPIRTEGNKILLPEGFVLMNGTKFRFQEISNTISLPVGAKVTFPEALGRKIFGYIVTETCIDDDCVYEDPMKNGYDSGKKTFTMKLDKKGNVIWGKD
ncbi:MAG: hypothetical protein RL757_2259 [Bacteroidota bacterium]|jgi:phage shock protein C